MDWQIVSPVHAVIQIEATRLFTETSIKADGELATLQSFWFAKLLTSFQSYKGQQSTEWQDKRCQCVCNQATVKLRPLYSVPRQNLAELEKWFQKQTTKTYKLLRYLIS